MKCQLPVPSLPGTLPTIVKSVTEATWHDCQFQRPIVNISNSSKIFFFL